MARKKNEPRRRNSYSNPGPSSKKRDDDDEVNIVGHFIAPSMASRSKVGDHGWFVVEKGNRIPMSVTPQWITEHARELGILYIESNCLQDPHLKKYFGPLLAKLKRIVPRERLNAKKGRKNGPQTLLLARRGGLKSGYSLSTGMPNKSTRHVRKPSPVAVYESQAATGRQNGKINRFADKIRLGHQEEIHSSSGSEVQEEESDDYVCSESKDSDYSEDAEENLGEEDFEVEIGKAKSTRPQKKKKKSASEKRKLQGGTPPHVEVLKQKIPCFDLT